MAGSPTKLLNAGAQTRCAFSSCARLLRPHNASGYCREHHRFSPADRATKAAYYLSHRDSLLEKAHIRKGFKSNYWTAGSCRANDCGVLLRSDNLSGLCKYHRKLEWAKKNYSPHKAAAIRCRQKYGLEITEKTRLLKEQGGCAICLEPASDDLRHWYTDHDHLTGEVRGILCNRCNSGLGQFRDNISFLLAAIAYLNRARS